MTEKNMGYITRMLQASAPYPDPVIEATIIAYICGRLQRTFHYEGTLAELADRAEPALLEEFRRIAPPLEIELIAEFFESLLEPEDVNEHGIVFTPQYIADYISAGVIPAALPPEAQPRVIDPGCGCGIFLVSAAECLHRALQRDYVELFNNCIYGIDLDPRNVRRCRIVLHLFVLMKNGDCTRLSPNLLCADSLKLRWDEAFRVDAFDFIIGNPPYVNTHDMTGETAAFLKQTFQTTRHGVYNIFYAFIEHALGFLCPTGRLSYIVPNNFLTIKSATDLRRLLAEHRHLERIVDFAGNMVFRPVRTYSCILTLSKQPRNGFSYAVLDQAGDIQGALARAVFSRMDTDKLSVHGWKLADSRTLANLRRIEGQPHSIRDLIRTGIATLCDEVYTVERDGADYYKTVGGTRYSVEPALVKRLYKIPDLKNASNIQDRCRYIIFPYRSGKNGFEIIDEPVLRETAPLTYRYLSARRADLDRRDKGKKNPVAWYAYGRTQGLNKYGRKLLFPTFASAPRFTLVEDVYALFCNGYAVFEGDFLPLPLLARVLNSQLMHYYVSNTSYTIEGGYFCYQKKFIERFSIPAFTGEEIAGMEGMDKAQLDAFLFERYGLDL